MQHFPDSFRLADAPQATVRLLVSRLPEFQHLTAARIACVFSERALFLHGGQKAAIIATGAHTQGPCRHFVEFMVAQFVAPVCEGEDPDFLILVDRAVFDALDPERRERLMYHELCHIHQAETDEGAPKFSREDGRPILKLVPHDTEVFDAEIERYGVEVVGIEHTAIAIAEGERRRRLRDTIAC